MRLRKFRNRLAGAASIMVAMFAGSVALGVSPASAAVPPDPSPLNGTAAPQYYNGNLSQQVRDSGSDTTIFLIQALSDLYDQAALYGCTPGVAEAVCASGQNASTTDTADNWDRTEVDTGINKVGSGDGQKELCGTEASPFPVDFARSSKPITGACTQEQAQGFAIDGVPEVDFQSVIPADFGPIPSTSPYFSAVDTSANLAANGGKALMGNVAAGWGPGDNAYCTVAATCTHGSNNTYSNITNNDNGGGANSQAYRLYCTQGSTQITDWGVLQGGTAFSPSIPVNIMGVNPTSGTNFTISTAFFRSGVTGTECDSDSNLNASTLKGNAHTALENNASQIADFLNTDFPNDAADQAAELSATLYYMSEGVLFSNKHAGTVSICSTGTANCSARTFNDGQTTSGSSTLTSSGAANFTSGDVGALVTGTGIPSGTIISSVTSSTSATMSNNATATGSSLAVIINPVRNYSVSKMKENNVSASSTTELGRTLPTARVLYNIFLNAPVAVASTGRSLTFTDGATTNGSPVITSSSQANFQPSDIGRQVSGSGIPASSYVVKYDSSTQVELNDNASATATGVSVTLSGTTLGLRASTAGFLNWLCATNSDSSIVSGGVIHDTLGNAGKGKDLNTGLNYDNEISTLINTTFGFNRIDDTVTTGVNADLCGIIIPAGTDPYPSGIAVSPLPGPIPFPDN